MQWLPIESAPKGERLLVWEDGLIHIAEWIEGLGWWFDIDEFDEHPRTNRSPSHWQPLPPPPGSDDEFVAIRRETME